MQSNLLLLRVYRCAVRALPDDFRTRYGEEMELSFTERLRDESTDHKWLATLAESCNVLLIAAQTRLGRQPLQAPALIALTVVLAFVRVPTVATSARVGLAPADSVDFVASDPAGDFTLHLRYGRAIGGTIDHQRLSRQQLIQTSDSIRVLNQRGRVLFAVAYNRDAAQIQWAARPAQCRGRALDCEIAP